MPVGLSGQGRSRSLLSLGIAGVVGVVVALAAPMAVDAQTLREALALTYRSNPTLLAQREALRSTNEQVSIALSGYRPFVQGTGQVGATYRDPAPTTGITDEVIYPASIGISVSQPVYRGGRTAATVRQAENLVQAARAQYLATEQQVLLATTTAYMDVVQQQAVLELQRNNEDVLRRQLEAAQDRFTVGEITRTDVSQAESRLAGAVAQRIAAEGTLRNAQATYERSVGQPPGQLVPPQPLINLTETLQQTITLAQQRSPGVLAAQFTAAAADDAVDSVLGELLPELALVGSATRSISDLGTDDTGQTTASLTAQLTIPLYQSGSVSARARQARFTAGQRDIEVTEAERAAIESGIAAWEGLMTAEASIESLRSQVRSSEIALEGVEQEALVGSRTTLDVLDAEQELLNARVNLVQAQRNEVVAGFQILSAIGSLTAADLGLPVQLYDLETDYVRSRGRLWGTSID